ncbi:MAG: DUF3857 domain-containing protein [Chitinophagaceae bacterium]|nr:DUF3857 domain-containing protein [Chitinophagaceae bacterium]
MLKVTGLVFSFLVSSFSALAGEGDYAVSNISAAMLAKANVVKRMEQISFEVMSNGEAIMRKKYALTILNENGDRQAGFLEFYDKLHDIKNIEGALYDAAGKELKRLKNKQIIDLTGMVESTLIDDSRRKYHNFYHKVYPYTVQYEVEIKYYGTLFFPVWLPREDENFSVEQSSISIISPVNYTVRYKAFNYSGEPALTTDKDKKTQTWQIINLPAIEDEYASPSWYEMNTVVLFAPTDFSIESYRGNMTSWGEFGKFVYSLKQGRDQLPENVKEAVHRIADPIKDPAEKIARLYEYLQKNTRYISIQLGIGGWQPFDAKYVATKAYGDCKALTNYMYSILKEVGITSYYTLVKAGRNANKIITDFPSQQFNHVILSVPLQKDTIWLECTSQTKPAGYLGDFTCDRYALMVDEKGGALVRTPKYGLKQNLQSRRIKATLNAEATLSINAFSKYEGLQQDLYHELIHGLSKDKVKEFLHEELDFATYDISSFEYKENQSATPSVEERLDIVVSNYATITGKRLFIIPNVMTRTHRKLPAVEERKFDLELGFEYNDIDSVEINIPEGYMAESMPQPASVNSQFGKYTSSVKLSGNQLFYYRNLEHYGGRFSASDYPELVKFYEAIYKADRSKVVLVKTETQAPKGF